MDLFNKTSVLFVCLGNICRSPAAEGILKQMAKQKGILQNLLIDSAGIGSWHAGQLPDRRMRICGEKNGYDFSSVARQLNKRDFERFDYIIVMDEDNYRDVRLRCPNSEYLKKIHKIKEYFTKYKNYQTVPDPYYGSMDDFQLAINLLEDACSTFLLRLSNS
ncbi:MAG: low molecular weight phosphotyrosine protein phosphatase [Bacteroidales bacterium]|nr:low molecular weight phosphotyrosine protein phosphatase [Bacteroidales bacterium]